jgi:hypothetical protein
VPDGNSILEELKELKELALTPFAKESKTYVLVLLRSTVMSLTSKWLQATITSLTSNKSISHTV